VRAKPIGFQVQLLNLSDTLSIMFFSACVAIHYLNTAELKLTKCLKFINRAM
jgi:hypothetical protein